LVINWHASAGAVGRLGRRLDSNAITIGSLSLSQIKSGRIDDAVHR
jgi:hypothetical protein